MGMLPAGWMVLGIKKSISRPAWVVCPYTYELWKAGGEPPAHVQLKADAAAQVVRLKFWAAEQAALRADTGLAPPEAAAATAATAAADDDFDYTPRPLPCQGPMASWVTADVEAFKMSLMRGGEYSAPRPDSATRA